MVNKFFATPQAALADVPDGATVMIGGFGNAGMPAELIDCLIAQGARDLTVVNNNTGNADTGLAALIGAGRVRKIVCSFPRQADSWHFDRLYRAGKLELELVAQEQMAARVARHIPDGAYVNLGIGLPTLVADHLPKGREIILHSENGVMGIGPRPAPGEEDEDLINAGKEPVTLLPGGSYFHHADFFGMIRGRHLDYCVLGAFQVSVAGDLANWHTGAPDAIPAVGGAMDLAVGAKNVLVMMEHLTKDGKSKIVDRCSYPLTGARCVTRIYTDLAVIDVTPDGLQLVEIVASDLSFDELQRLNGVPLKYLAAA